MRSAVDDVNDCDEEIVQLENNKKMCGISSIRCIQTNLDGDCRVGNELVNCW